MTHDVAGCPRLACDLCDAYRSGYSDGKDKMAFEIETVLRSNHGAGCGCRPCATVRAVLTSGLPFAWTPYEQYQLWGG